MALAFRDQDELIQGVKKYFDYFFETRGFTSDGYPTKLSQAALQTAAAIRGQARKPAILIQGVMPRAGTVYVGELLRRHPDVYAYPYQLWEFPALLLADDISKVERKFLRSYRLNRGKIGERDFLALFGASLIAFAHHQVPEQQRLLLKMPSVQYLGHFFSMFPCENLLILLRDGRDVVHSTLKTWPRLNFLQVCLRWNRSALAVIEARNRLDVTGAGRYWLGRYEDALRDPRGFVLEACRHLDLDESVYPFEAVEDVRVIGSSGLSAPGDGIWRHVRKPDGFKPVEYWRRWSPMRKTIFKLVAGRSLVSLGYAKDLHW